MDEEEKDEPERTTDPSDSSGNDAALNRWDHEISGIFGSLLGSDNHIKIKICDDEGVEGYKLTSEYTETAELLDSFSMLIDELHGLATAVAAKEEDNDARTVALLDYHSIINHVQDGRNKLEDLRYYMRNTPGFQNRTTRVNAIKKQLDSKKDE